MWLTCITGLRYFGTTIVTTPHCWLRYERRSFGREFDRDRDKDRHRDRAERNRYGDRRRAYSDNREEEPEWFSG